MNIIDVSATRLDRAFWTTTALLCALALAGEPSHAFADDGPPSRIGNIYGGLDHQPTQSEVSQRERAARINLDTKELKRNAAILNELYRKLENRAATAFVTAQQCLGAFG